MTEQHWTLDKRVPLALILTLLAQTAGGVWWASNITGRVGVNERALTRLEAVVDATRTSAAQQAVQLGRIEEQISGLRNDVMRVLATIERNNR